MIKAFLSHSSAQKYFVRNLAKEIGFDHCILDENNFEAGYPTLEEIYKNLGDSNIFILLLSDEALNSDWVGKEISKAKKLFKNGQIERFHPFIIDDKISYEDYRIDDWVRKNYLILKIDSYVLLGRKINEIIREIAWKKNPILRIKSEVYVGRNLLTDELETKIYSGQFNKRRAIVASGWEGVGRKKFLKHFVLEKQKNKKAIDPFVFELDSKQSIEDFIIQLNDKLLYYDVNDIAGIITNTIEQKLYCCIDLIKKITDENEVIIIQDRGACILPNRNISSWFLDVVKHGDFPSKICLYLASNFKPHYKVEELFPQIICIQVDELERKDRAKLFYAYLSKLEIELSSEDSNFFLEKFSGQPEQIIYTVDIIRKESLHAAKKRINEILEIGDRQVLVMLDFLKSFKGGMDLLVLISKFDFISYDLIVKINTNQRQVEELLEEFLAISAISHFGSNNQYFRLNSAIADYIKRSHIKIKDDYLKKMKTLFEEFSTAEAEVELKDISLFLFNVKEAIRRELSFSHKFFIPSFVLRTIVDIYYKSKYNDVIKLCDKVLYDSINYYEEIIREVRYWLCLSLCRLRDNRFFQEVGYFRDIDEDFLNGFYFRIAGAFEKAEYHYNKILGERDIPKVKRELVNVLLGERRYMDALELAKENYESKRSNTYHIEAYFKCLVRKYRPTSADRNKLQELIKGIQESYDSKKDVIARTMVAEYDYYISQKITPSINALADIIANNSYNFYAIKSLIEIYEKQENFGAANELRAKHRKKLSEPDESFETY